MHTSFCAFLLLTPCSGSNRSSCRRCSGSNSRRGQAAKKIAYQHGRQLQRLQLTRLSNPLLAILGGRLRRVEARLRRVEARVQALEGDKESSQIQYTSRCGEAIRCNTTRHNTVRVRDSGSTTSFGSTTISRLPGKQRARCSLATVATEQRWRYILIIKMLCGQQRSIPVCSLEHGCIIVCVCACPAAMSLLCVASIAFKMLPHVPPT